MHHLCIAVNNINMFLVYFLYIHLWMKALNVNIYWIFKCYEQQSKKKSLLKMVPFSILISPPFVWLIFFFSCEFKAACNHITYHYFCNLSVSGWHLFKFSSFLHWTKVPVFVFLPVIGACAKHWCQWLVTVATASSRTQWSKTIALPTSQCWWSVPDVSSTS